MYQLSKLHHNVSDMASQKLTDEESEEEATATADTESLPSSPVTQPQNVTSSQENTTKS